MAVNELIIDLIVCFLAGAGAGLGTGFAGMSAAAIVGPLLLTFCGVPAYQAIGIGLASDVLASAVSAYTYGSACSCKTEELYGTIGQAFKKYPLAVLLHEADLEATY